MKKIITFIMLMALAIPVFAADTLWQYYGEKGLSLPPISERAIIYNSLWDEEYSGTYNQNVRLLNHLQGYDNIGFAPTTGFSARLSQSISASATTIPVTSVTDSDDLTLPCSATNKCYFNIEQGTSREERVVCASITGTTLTDCTRGLVATGNSETGSSTLTMAHNAGSRIIMTNIAQFYSNYLNLYDNATLAGDLTFTGDLDVTGGSITVPAPSGDTNAATKLYVDTVGAGGFTSVNASTTKGLEVFGTSPETVGVNIDTAKGLAFQADGELEVVASSTGGIAVDSNGLYVDTSDNFDYTGDVTFSASTTWEVLPEYDSDPIGDDEATRKSYVDDNDNYYYQLVCSSNTNVSNNSSVYSGVGSGLTPSTDASDWYWMAVATTTVDRFYVDSDNNTLDVAMTVSFSGGTGDALSVTVTAGSEATFIDTLTDTKTLVPGDKFLFSWSAPLGNGSASDNAACVRLKVQAD